MRKGVMVFILLLLSAVSQARQLGVVGSVFPVAEISLLSLIESRIAQLSKEGGLERINQDFIQRASNHADRPFPNHLKRISVTTSHFYNPEIRLSQTLTDHRGQILYPAGTRVNALDRMPNFKPCWIFFNGDDKSQVAFVRNKIRQCANPKIILTEGSVGDAEKTLNAVIYFDQDARIAKKIKLSHVPAVVRRDKSQLKVTEFAIREDGHEI